MSIATITIVLIYIGTGSISILLLVFGWLLHNHGPESEVLSPVLEPTKESKQFLYTQHKGFDLYSLFTPSATDIHDNEFTSQKSLLKYFHGLRHGFITLPPNCISLSAVNSLLCLQ